MHDSFTVTALHVECKGMHCSSIGRGSSATVSLAGVAWLPAWPRGFFLHLIEGVLFVIGKFVCMACRLHVPLFQEIGAAFCLETLELAS